VNNTIKISESKKLQKEDVLALYHSIGWSAAHKPDLLYKGLLNSHSLVTAWQGSQLVGLGNAISDGYLVVYYPHLLVHPEFQGIGVGQKIVNKLQERYADFHMQMLTADGGAIEFYKKNGFSRAGETEPMWIYQGEEH